MIFLKTLKINKIDITDDTLIAYKESNIFEDNKIEEDKYRNY